MTAPLTSPAATPAAAPPTPQPASPAPAVNAPTPSVGVWILFPKTLMTDDAARRAQQENDLRAAFNAYNPSSARVIPKKGYAFLDLPDETSRDNAVQALDGKDITVEGQQVNVKVQKSRPRTPRTTATRTGRPPAPRTHNSTVQTERPTASTAKAIVDYDIYPDNRGDFKITIRVPKKTRLVITSSADIVLHKMVDATEDEEQPPFPSTGTAPQTHNRFEMELAGSSYTLLMLSISRPNIPMVRVSFIFVDLPSNITRTFRR
jgi:hypothetical protein